jgi:hypothetical protein
MTGLTIIAALALGIGATSSLICSVSRMMPVTLLNGPELSIAADGASDYRRKRIIQRSPQARDRFDVAAN